MAKDAVAKFGVFQSGRVVEEPVHLFLPDEFFKPGYKRARDERELFGKALLKDLSQVYFKMFS